MKPVVLITGVAGGIGSATAELFAEKGWHVVGIDRKEAEVKGVGRFVAGDVSLDGVPERMISEITRIEGQLNALVNNAAVQICKSIHDTTLEDWDTIMASNVRAPFSITRSAIPLLKETKGAIVNVSSVHAIATSYGIAAYAASKGALMALTRALALELAPHGIRINAILPGAVDTPMLRSGLMRGHLEGDSLEDRLKQLSEKHIMKRIGKPSEIASSIFFLADSQQSSFITGQALLVDGGATAKLSTE